MPLLLSTSDIDFDMLEYIRNIFVTNMVHPIAFSEFLFTIILLFIIRGVLMYKMEAENGANMLRHKIYIFVHIGFELFISYMVSYGVVVLTGGDPKHIGINLFGAPLFGFMISVFLDMKVIMELEKDMNIGIPNEFKKKKCDCNSTKKDSNDNNITINVGSTPTQQEINNKPAIFSGDINRLYIDKTKLTEENCKERVIDTINNIITIQDQQSDIIADNTDKINEIASIIDILRETELNDKRIELKGYIYTCLNNGFATPEENDIITTKYQSYRALHGNHEVQSLYENHYLLLQVHVDRRKRGSETNYTGVERRYEGTRCVYGQFDNEIIEENEEEIPKESD